MCAIRGILVAQYTKSWNTMRPNGFFRQTQRNVIPIPKSDNPERLRLNIDIFGFTLTEEELERMLSLNKNKRCTEFHQ